MYTRSLSSDNSYIFIWPSINYMPLLTYSVSQLYGHVL